VTSAVDDGLVGVGLPHPMASTMVSAAAGKNPFIVPLPLDRNVLDDRIQRSNTKVSPIPSSDRSEVARLISCALGGAHENT
jgi:hypothetical protein